MFKSIEKIFIIPRNEIYFVNFILESYEDIGFITTLEPHIAKIKITISPFFLDDFNKIIKSISKEIEIKDIT